MAEPKAVLIPAHLTDRVDSIIQKMKSKNMECKTLADSVDERISKALDGKTFDESIALLKSIQNSMNHVQVGTDEGTRLVESSTDFCGIGAACLTIPQRQAVIVQEVRAHCRRK